MRSATIRSRLARNPAPAHSGWASPKHDSAKTSPTRKVEGYDLVLRDIVENTVGPKPQASGSAASTFSRAAICSPRRLVASGFARSAVMKSRETSAAMPRNADDGPAPRIEYLSARKPDPFRSPGDHDVSTHKSVLRKLWKSCAMSFFLFVVITAHSGWRAPHPLH